MFRLSLPFVMFLAAGCLLLPRPASARVVDGIAAIVNEDVILVSEINEAMRPLIREYRQRYTGAELRVKLHELQEAVVDKAIEDRLVLQVAATAGIDADKSQIDERMQAVISRFGSVENFETEIEGRGISPREYRAQIREQIIVQETVRQVVGAKVRVTDNEIEAYYRTHRDEFEQADARQISTIFLPYPADVPASRRGSVRRRAEQILMLLSEGAQFGELARKFSHGPHRNEGGNVGFVSRGEILPVLEQAAFAEKTGGPPQLVETASGIHLLTVTAERPGRLIPLSEARPRIQARLTEEKQAKRYDDWIDTLRGQSYIDRKL